MNLVDDVFRRAVEAPSRQALAYEGRSWTYAELKRAILAGADFLARSGVARGDRVALILRNRPESLFALFSCWTIGAVPVLVSPLYGPADMRGALGKTEPRFALLDRSLADAVAAVDEAGVAMLDLDGFLAQVERGESGLAAPLSLDPDHESSILFTGGTTGTPKAVIATHGGTLATMGKLASASKKDRPPPYPIAPEGVSPNLTALPLFHSGGQQSMLFSYHVGRSVVLIERFSPDAVGAAVARHRIDNLFLLPTMLYDLAYATQDIDLGTVRSVLVAGGATDAETRAAFERRYAIPLLSNYGSTEIGHVAGWTAHDVRQGLWRPGSAGRVYPGVDVEIRDEDGGVLPAGEIGEVCVRTGLTTGYAGSGDEASDIIHVDGWVLSGDLGRIDAEGVLYLAGRKRELIKCGGFQIFPGELEDVLRQHPAVADVAVVGVPDQRMGQVPKAFVVRRSSADEAGLADALVAHVRDRLAHYKTIRAVGFIAELPRTVTGKIDRAALAAAGAEREHA